MLHAKLKESNKVDKVSIIFRQSISKSLTQPVCIVCYAAAAITGVNDSVIYNYMHIHGLKSNHLADYAFKIIASSIHKSWN